MRRLVLLAVCGATAAWAGERYLGTLYVRDGGSTNNAETTRLGTGIQGDGGLVVADGGATDSLYSRASFVVPSNAKLSLQCRGDSYVGVDVRGCDAGRCLRLPGEYLLPTSTGEQKTFTVTYFTGVVNYDGGLATATATYSGGLVAASPCDGGASLTCDVFSRSGTE